MRHRATAVELIKPQSGIVTIDDTDPPMPMEQMEMNAASLHWEFMFARAMHQPLDMIEEHNLLSWVADRVDDRTFKTTVSEMIEPISAANLRAAHAKIEAGTAKGKIVLSRY